ncbi:MAG: hypothetical protein KC420_04250 [Myxococcales bacterium]|nr:hypothetical protein [Myxococcales bacterium]MCB9568195.1 hypothetical protein [Myxococcales bacterium]MCB9705417.1 hypothetical protein [Myxococcales bacterium]
MTRRPWIALTLIAGLCLPACGDGKKAEEPKKEEEAKAEEAKKEEAKPEEEKPKEVKLELPWVRERVAGAMKSGTVLTYKLSGSDAKGKPVDDDYRCEVKRSDDKTVGTVCNTVKNPSKDKGANEVATRDWSRFSPFFAVEKPEHTLVKVEDVTVPAGDFKCVVVELKDFFGANFTVWMIADKPGIYAKVEENGRIGDDEDKTKKVFELASIEEGT